MNDMNKKHDDLLEAVQEIGDMLGVSELCAFSDYVHGVTVAAANLAARAEVLEREYATVSRIISAIESRAKEEEVQVLQGAICPGPTDAGSVQPSVCETASRG